MGQFVQLFPENPQPRVLKQIIDVVKKGGIIVYPTDSAYALGCQMANNEALNKIKQIRGLDDKHDFTLVCRDLKEVGLYGQVDNAAFRVLKALTPGPFTFLFKATKEVPKRLINIKRKTVGLRVPDNIIAQALLNELDEPLMSSTLIMPGEDFPEDDPYEIFEKLEALVDVVIDAGSCGRESTTVIDFTIWPPVLVRQGKGDASQFVE